MARSRHSKGGHFRRGQREATVPSNPFATLRVLPPLQPIPMPKPLTLLGDARVYHPQGHLRPAPALRSEARAYKPHGIYRFHPRSHALHATWPTPFLGFRIPSQVAVCVRRKVRRSVLHALRRTSAGSRSQKRKRSPWSDIRC